MTAATARNKIGFLVKIGAIDFAEACRRLDRIGAIVRMSVPQAEKQSLFAIVAA